MTDTALLKINRATKHIDDLAKMFTETPPATLALRTNTNTSMRAIRTKSNKAVIDHGACVAGDALHNLRAALDHAYWRLVEPYIFDPQKRKKIQFPFSIKGRDGLDAAVSNRFAKCVSTAFFDCIMSLQPHNEPGGDELLYAVHRLNTVDKHMLAVPMVDVQTFTVSDIRCIDRSFMPMHNPELQITIGGNPNITTDWKSKDIRDEFLGRAVPPLKSVFDYELDIPVNIVFAIRTTDDPQPMVETLYKMRDRCKEVIDIIREAATL